VGYTKTKVSLTFAIHKEDFAFFHELSFLCSIPSKLEGLLFALINELFIFPRNCDPLL